MKSYTRYYAVVYSFLALIVFLISGCTDISVPSEVASSHVSDPSDSAFEPWLSTISEKVISMSSDPTKLQTNVRFVDRDRMVQSTTIIDYFYLIWGVEGDRVFIEVYDDVYARYWFDYKTGTMDLIEHPELPEGKMGASAYGDDWIAWVESPPENAPIGNGWKMKAANLVSGEYVEVDEDDGAEPHTSRTNIMQPLVIYCEKGFVLYRCYEYSSTGEVVERLKLFNLETQTYIVVYEIAEEDTNLTKMNTYYMNDGVVAFTVSSTHDFMHEFGKAYAYIINQDRLVAIESDLNITYAQVSGKYIAAFHRFEGEMWGRSVVVGSLETQEWLVELRPEDLNLKDTGYSIEYLDRLSFSGDYINFNDCYYQYNYLYCLSTGELVDLNAEANTVAPRSHYFDDGFLIWCGGIEPLMWARAEYLTLVDSR